MNLFFFFNDTATTEIYTLSLHDALPIWPVVHVHGELGRELGELALPVADERRRARDEHAAGIESLGQALATHVHEHRRSEEHTSELQSRQYLVCRLLLEKKKTKSTTRDE